MTPANLSNNTMKPSSNPMSSTHRTAIVAGCFLVLVIVVAIVYSKHARNAEVSSTSSVPTATAPITPTTVAAETLVPAPAPKKAAKKGHRS